MSSHSHTVTKRMFALAVSLVVMWTTTEGFAQQSAADLFSTEELRALQTIMGKQQYLKVDFVQTRQNTLRSKPQMSNGVAYFSKPGKFRWETIKPKSETKIFNGKKLFSLNDAEKIATFFEQGDQVEDLKEIVDVVLDFDALLKRYDIVQATREKKEVVIELRPKAKGALSNITLRILGKEALVKYVKLTFEGQKNASEFEFSGHSRAKIDSKVFESPVGYKVTKGF